MIQILVDHPEGKKYELDSVRAVRCGASSIPEAVLRRAMELFPGADFYQDYGMTETAIVAVLGAS
jgi:acyl-CoA synthetase (AMP-forming)/AMP-acid ligase II